MYSMKVNREKVDISNFTGPLLIKILNKMGRLRIVRQQYRRWGGKRCTRTRWEVPPPYHNSAASRTKEGR